MGACPHDYLSKLREASVTRSSDVTHRGSDALLANITGCGSGSKVGETSALHHRRLAS
jgi:hypothetical protein